MSRSQCVLATAQVAPGHFRRPAPKTRSHIRILSLTHFHFQGAAEHHPSRSVLFQLQMTGRRYSHIHAPRRFEERVWDRQACFFPGCDSELAHRVSAAPRP